MPLGETDYLEKTQIHVRKANIGGVGRPGEPGGSVLSTCNMGKF